MESDREKAQETCEEIQHKWIEEYYGYRCEKCDLFYAYGCAPWELDPDEEEPVCAYCGKRLEDWSDIGCEYCDTRHPYYGIVP